jgi:2-polyprenyl-6-methoxyphenol hydroxylase-like FAD-dependent oxidoreductase
MAGVRPPTCLVRSTPARWLAGVIEGRAVRTLVVGGGMAGLASAIALRAAGVEAVVFEQANELEEIGAGLTLAPNAMQAIDRLGVGEGIRRRGARARRIRVPTAGGRTLFDIDLERAGREAIGIHRADLQRTLLEALPADVVRLGQRCVGFEQDHNGVHARFENGREESGEVLIGADGIHSAVRRELFGPVRLRYGNHAGWRAAVPFEHELVEGTWSETWGRRARIGIVPIGGGRIYLYVAEDVPEGAAAPANPEEAFRRRFADWHSPIPAALAAAASGSFSRTFTYDTRPLRRWTVGRVTLVGDAAHPMRPDIGMGAAVALEDAVALGNSFRASTETVHALRSYEKCRRKRGAFMIRRSRQAGSFAQCKSAVGCRVRDAIALAMPAWISEAQYRRQIRWDPDCPR